MTKSTPIYAKKMSNTHIIGDVTKTLPDSVTILILIT